MAQVWEDRTKRRFICTAAAFEGADVEVNLIRVFWEKVGVLGPVYRLVGQDFSDRDIATKLNLMELSVQGCIVWILHFLKLSDRKASNTNSYS